MQTIQKVDVLCSPEESGSENSYKIADMLLDYRDDRSEEEAEEFIEYEIKIDYQEKPKVRKPASQESKKGKKYLMHTPEIKRECVKMAMETDIKTAAAAYNVPLKSLKRWITVGPDRKKGGGRKIRDPEMERKLYEWYYDHHYVKNLPVTSKMIKNKALEFSCLHDFNASKGWLEKLKKKYNLKISRSSGIKN